MSIQTSQRPVEHQFKALIAKDARCEVPFYPGSTRSNAFSTSRKIILSIRWYSVLPNKATEKPTVVSKTQLHCGPAPPSVSLIDGIAPNIDSAYGSFSVKIFPLTSVGSVPVIFP